MNAPEALERRRTLHRRVVSAVFALCLLAPLVGSIGGWGGDVAALEYRTPAPLPGFPSSAAALEAFPSALDAYLEDHFGFRSRLVALNSRLHLAFGVSASPKFMVGKDGWMFDRWPLEQYRGTERFASKDLEDWVRRMKRHDRFLASRGIRMLIMVVPGKLAIYSDYVPDWVNVVEPEGRYQQLVARLAGEPELELLDLRAPLLEARRHQRVYHKTDDHWNQLGAYVAYAALVDKLRDQYPDLPLRSLDWFTLKWEWKPSGAIAQRLGIADLMPEEVPELRPRSASHVIRTRWPNGRPATSYEQLVAVSVIDSDLPEQPSIVFVRDSFATDIARFAQESFRRTGLVHHGYGAVLGFPRKEVLSLEPDVVVFELLEAGLEWKLH